MNSIGIFNKKDLAIKETFIENVGTYKGLEPTVCANLCDLKTCDIVLAHAFETDWTELINKWSRPGSVRVRVSTAGFDDKPAPELIAGVNTFYLVPRADRLSSKDWKAILDGLSDPQVVKDLVKGKKPNDLRPFFVREVQEHLSALTLFCEGYLAVHAESPDCQADIHAAVVLMEWDECRDSEIGERFICQNLDERKADLRKSEWWLQVFERESFEDDVKKEWKKTETGEMPPAISDLLEDILNCDTVEPKTVANAYCALSKKKL